MAHNHSHHHHVPDSKNIKTAFFLNFAFTIIEIIGGILTNSMAIIADAIHDLGDSLSLGLAWYLQNLSKKGRNASYSYGYRRFSVLGAFITSIVLIIGSVIILWKTIPRFITPEETDAKGMFLLAIIGVVVNGIAVLKTRKGSSLNEKVVSLHLLEDVLGWLAVLIGAVIMYFFNAPWIDPLLSLLIAVFVLKNVYQNLKQVIKIIMQGTPSTVELAKVEQILNSLSEVKSYHDLHLWTMDGEYDILTVHLVVEDYTTHQQIFELKQKVKHIFYNEHIEHATIEVELHSQDCEYEKLHE